MVKLLLKVIQAFGFEVVIRQLTHEGETIILTSDHCKITLDHNYEREVVLSGRTRRGSTRALGRL